MEVQKGCIKGCEEFEYIGIKIDKEDRQENYIKNKINKGRTWQQCWIVYCGTGKWPEKIQIHNSVVKSTVTYGVETWKIRNNLESNLRPWKLIFLADRRDA